ncbi:MAG: 3-hydroxyacyl-CoA dehydrogenase NAD-binding domain-containing protein [Planctomycetota bacterium]
MPTTSDAPPPVAVYGCGTIGASWATLFALNPAVAGEVRLFDITAEARAAGRAKIDAMLATVAGLTSAQRTAAQARLKVCATSAEALAGVGFIQESVLERYPIKADTHADIERHAPVQALVASSSSGLLASKMQETWTHPERFLVGHPFNPPHLIPLVELVPGPRTSEAALAAAGAFYTALGKIPVVLRKEVPGHIANRLAAAVWREALDLVDHGVASLEDVDKALCAGPGLRWALMGQHLIYHLNGGAKGYAGFFDQFESQFAKWWEDMARWTAIPPGAKTAALAQIAAAADGKSVAELEARRDRQLQAILAVLKADAQD